MRLNAVHPRLHFWLGNALVALMDAPPLVAGPYRLWNSSRTADSGTVAGLQTLGQ